MTQRLLVRIAAVSALALALASCGFQLRGSNGQYDMPFTSIYLGFPETSPLGVELKRNLRGGKAVVVDDITQADAALEVLSEHRNKQILSLNSQGRVREYLLLYTLVFRVRDNKGGEILPPTEITLKRNISFNESQTLAKESEEALLYRDMQADLVQQIMRRLAALKRA
ncbi:MAG TPA: LPS assembly lipoprotein LptE [Telluria sp.]|nr:LPS assembly lipoprotein LptE [Telluria sp.]